MRADGESHALSDSPEGSTGDARMPTTGSVQRGSSLAPDLFPQLPALWLDEQVTA